MRLVDGIDDEDEKGQSDFVDLGLSGSSRIWEYHDFSSLFSTGLSWPGGEHSADCDFVSTVSGLFTV